LAAQLPEHLLLGAVSFLNRYNVRPRESTRIFPKPVRRTWTVARRLLRATEAALTELSMVGCVVAAFTTWVPPTKAKAVSGITAALARKVLGVLRVMSLLGLGSIDTRTDRPGSNQETRSPLWQKLVVAPRLAALRGADALMGAREFLLVGLCQLTQPLQVSRGRLLAVARCAICEVRRGTARRGCLEPSAESVRGLDLCLDPCHVRIV
jgi:hypothetical protein